jgi:HAD superfamily hydrolase (TIGR01509 family)
MWKAVLFDFDGLLVDTESAGLIAWQEIYEHHGQHLDLSLWQSLIGATMDHDWATPLLEACGRELDLEDLHRRRRSRRNELCTAAAGAHEVLDAARDSGLATALVSNSSLSWVGPTSARAGIHIEAFDVVVTGDRGHPRKPDPAGYRLALGELDVSASEAVAFEDSAAGVAAASGAGIRCIAVPNPVTQHQDFGAAAVVATELAPSLLAYY